jgi:apolipoprotein N-acyltransferase
MLGAERGYYHKRHLVLFGEYYPMRWLLDLFTGLINIPYSDLTAGPREQPLMQVDGNTLGVSICFEDVFSREVLRALPEASLLVNVSNDAWFGNSSAPHQHLQIAQMRAQETERVMIRSTNTGVSAFIDHKGRVLSETRQFETESLTASLQGRTGTTPFYYFAKVQGGLAVLPFVVVFLVARRKAG